MRRLCVYSLGLSAVGVLASNPSISVPSLDSANSLTAGSVGYQASSNMFSIDVGALGNSNSNSGSALGVPQPVDYGMAYQEFNGPAASYTTNLRGYIAPDIAIRGCMPSSNQGNCVKGGESNYGIALPRNFVRATSSR
jgi:hypothetical protein